MAWARVAKVEGSFAEVCAGQQTRQHLLRQLVAAARAAKVKVSF